MFAFQALSTFKKAIKGQDPVCEFGIRNLISQGLAQKLIQSLILRYPTVFSCHEVHTRSLYARLLLPKKHNT